MVGASSLASASATIATWPTWSTSVSWRSSAGDSSRIGRWKRLRRDSSDRPRTKACSASASIASTGRTTTSRPSASLMRSIRALGKRAPACAAAFTPAPRPGAAGIAQQRDEPLPPGGRRTLDDLHAGGRVQRLQQHAGRRGAARSARRPRAGDRRAGRPRSARPAARHAQAGAAVHARDAPGRQPEHAADRGRVSVWRCMATLSQQ